MLLRVLAKNWWMVLLRGVAAILFGIAAIAWPDLAVGVFVALFGAYALVDGIFAIVAAFQGEEQDRLWHVAQGALGIIVGLVAWVYPDLTAVSLLYFIGAWALITGVLQTVAAIRLRDEITNEGWLILAGALSALFGVLCFLRPRDSALALTTLIGVFAILMGVILVLFSLRLRSLRERVAQAVGRGRAQAGA
jgi:uncharacterized membrane protein HdeD (DUF308 family)